MRAMSSGDHKRASEWIVVQSHTSVDKKCFTTPREGSEP